MDGFFYGKCVGFVACAHTSHPSVVKIYLPYRSMGDSFRMWFSRLIRTHFHCVGRFNKGKIEFPNIVKAFAILLKLISWSSNFMWIRGVNMQNWNVTVPHSFSLGNSHQKKRRYRKR